MNQPIKIMAAVDLSEYSPTIVRYSAALAKKLNAELILVNVINQRDLDMIARTMAGYEIFSFPNYLTEQVEVRKTKMKDLFETASTESVACRYLVQPGIPYRELLTVIDDERPQLMVVGSKGRGNLADVVVGSTARKMVRRSPIPVLSIPAGFTEQI